MGRPYTVVWGDTLTRIAREQGYDSWRDIYYHDDNEDFRRRRPNPDRIYVDDVLILPDLGVPSGVPPDIPPDIPPEIPPDIPPGAPPNKSMFNFFWLYPIPPDLGDGLPVTRTTFNVLGTTGEGIPAIILYPALVTPAIVVDQEKIEFLILTSGASLTCADVNAQLKFSTGLDAAKSYSSNPLFAQDVGAAVEIETITFNDCVTETHERLACLMDSRALTLYQDKGFTTLHRVRVDSACLFNRSGGQRQFNRVVGDLAIPQETQDLILCEVLESMNGPLIAEKGKYAFMLDGDTVDLTQIDKTSPIQAYHPVFHYRSLTHASLGHLSDLHMSARQHLLAQSKARVIEYVEPDPEGVLQEADLDVSPYIGDHVNISSRSVQRVLQGLGGPAQPDIIIIGGDLIDCIKSWYPQDPSTMLNPTVKQIWDQVSLADGYDSIRYQNFVDFITMYTLIVNFYNDWEKPVFAISGNHDCYYMTYGISPRVRLGDADLKRANEGIPADHNLTFYEAILAFGDTYYETRMSHLTTLFEKSMFKWFYTVLTPICDFAVHLPHQSLIGLGWGDDEDQLDVPVIGQGLGHLPRSEEAITDKQFEVVNKAVAKGAQDAGRRLILTSHFTFISYLGGGPIYRWDEAAGRWVRPEGDVYVGSNYDKFDEGTFENHREDLYSGLLVTKKIHTVITGHSHHRGLHAILRLDTYGRDSVDTRLYDFESLAQMKSDGCDVPAVIVSDSAGPIPRFNYSDEFEKWGSTRCSGTVVLFNEAGDMTAVYPVPVEPRPRFPVVVDYVDTYAWGDALTSRWFSHVIDTFESDDFSENAESRGAVGSYRFTVRLHDEIRKYVRIDGIRIYLTWPEEGICGRATFQAEDGSFERWRVDGLDAEWFRYIAAVQGGRRTFMAMKFARADDSYVTAGYDFDAWWTFECQIETGGNFLTDLFSSSKNYLVKRDRSRAEVPDFDWRAASMAKYQ